MPAMVVLWGRGKCPVIRRMSVGRSLARRSSRIYIYGTAQPLDGRTDRAADSSVRIKAYFSHSQRLERLAGLLDTTAHTHTRLTALCPELPGSAGTRKVKPIWILLKQETVGGSGITWAICKSAPRSRQITTPAPHQSVFYMPDALPAAQPTASQH